MESNLDAASATAEALSLPNSTVIDDLVKRINGLRFWSAATFVLIFVLIGSGVGVFFFAPNITDFDRIGQSLEQREIAIDTQINALEKRNREIHKKIDPEYSAYQIAVTEFIQRTPRGDDHPRGESVRIVEQLFPAPKLAKAIEEAIDGAQVNETGVLQITISHHGAVIHSIPEWRNIIDVLNRRKFSPNISDEELIQLWREMEENSRKIQFYTDVKNGIYGQKIQQEITGKVAEGAELTGSWQRIIQTNITRFGTLAMITFLVSVLIPLYKYNRRLLAFYQARRDALLLIRGELTTVGFETLCRVLTPQIDFGKTPQTPIEQVIELVRAVGSATRPPQN